MRKLFLALIGLCSIAVSAQTAEAVRMDSTISDHRIIYVGHGEEPAPDSVQNLIRRFYADQFRHFQDPLAPYFLFMSKDADLAMGVGGAVRMRAYADFDGVIQSPAFAPYLIPMSETPGHSRRIASTPAGTCLFFRVLGNNKKWGNYQLYIEADFNGYQSRDFHLKKSYGQINDWTIGYTSSTFSDPTALPPVVDAAGPNAKMDATALLLRWCHEFRGGWWLAASVESPTCAIDYKPDLTGQVDQWLPDIAAFGQYMWSGNHIRLSGIMRFMPYRDIQTSTDYNVPCWGLQLSGKYSPHRLVTLYATVNGGRGFQSLGGDWLMGRYDLVNNPDLPGRMYAPGAIGGFAAVQVNLNPMMFFSATYGATRYMPKSGVASDEYKSGTFMAFNYYWYLTQRISCAAEFDLGNRLNMDGSRAWAHRVNLMAQFSF